MNFERMTFILLAGLALILLVSCSANVASNGRRLISQRDYGRAQVILRQEVLANPGNMEAWQALAAC